jgi:hypothetical protein
MDAAAYVDAAAGALGLTIDPRHRAAVIFHVQLAASMAARLEGVPLGPADESPNVFRPVGPGQLAGPPLSGSIESGTADAKGAQR